MMELTQRLREIPEALTLHVPQKDRMCFQGQEAGSQMLFLGPEVSRVTLGKHGTGWFCSDRKILKRK